MKQTTTTSDHPKKTKADYSAYLDVCRRAVTDERVYATFRSLPAYTAILGHVTEKQGLEYFRQLPAWLRLRLYEFSRTEPIGDPYVIQVDGSFISPTTLRYMKVMGDLTALWPEFYYLGRHLAEIGVGYGGQAQIIHRCWPFVERYTLIDLQPVLDLTRKFLGHSNKEGWVVEYKTGDELDDGGEYDLVISNYAFTEFPRDTQELYFDRVLKRSKAGYITYNGGITPASYRSMAVEELCERLGARSYLEVPLTHEGNCIIVWGTDRLLK